MILSLSALTLFKQGFIYTCTSELGCEPNEAFSKYHIDIWIQQDGMSP